MSLDDAPSAADIELIEAEAWAELQLNLSPALRNQFGVRVERIGGGVVLLASRSTAVAINRTIALGLRDDCSDADLDAVIAEYRGAGIERFVIQWSPAASPRYTPEWFAARGFTLLSRIAKVYRRVPAGGDEFPLDPRLIVSEIGTDEVEVFEQIVAGPLRVPEGMAAGVRSTVGCAGWHYYLVRDAGRPIAGGAMYVRGAHAWLGLCATVDSDRGRGAQTALLARRLRDAADAGCEWASADTVARMGEPPNQSYRNMRRVGFSLLYERPNYVMEPGSVR